MKRIVSVLIAAAIIVSTLSFCGCSLLKRNAKLSAGVFNEVKSFDPIKANGDAETIIATNCFEGLFRFAATGEPELSGATGYNVSPDGLTYTFTLNPEAIWYVSDANKVILGDSKKDFDKNVTAEDYTFAFIRALKEKAAGYESLLYIKGASKFIKGDCDEKGVSVTAVDSHTLKIELTKPYSDLISVLASPICMPVSQAFYEKAGNLFGTTASTVICNGPYYTGESDDLGVTVLKRNPDYMGKGSVMNSSVTLHFTGKSDYEFSRFQDGVYNIFRTKSTEVLKDVTAEKLTQRKAIWGIAADCSGVMKNANLRKALFSKIDYTTIKTPSFSSEAASTIVAPDYTVGTKTYGAFATDELNFKTDAEKAASYAKKAQSEITGNITITVAVPKALEASFKTIAEQWKILFGGSLTAEIITFDPQKLQKFLEDNNYDLAVMPVSSKSDCAVSVLEGISGFPCYFSNKKLSSLIKTAKFTADESEKAAAISSAESYIVENAVFVPLITETNDIYLGENIGGIYEAGFDNMVYFSSGAEK